MGNSFLLIVVGLAIFYLVISDKWKCVEGFAACVANKKANGAVLPQTFLKPNEPLAVDPYTFTSSNWGANNYGF